MLERADAGREFEAARLARPDVSPSPMEVRWPVAEAEDALTDGAALPLPDVLAAAAVCGRLEAGREIAAEELTAGPALANASLAVFLWAASRADMAEEISDMGNTCLGVRVRV